MSRAYRTPFNRRESTERRWLVNGRWVRRPNHLQWLRDALGLAKPAEAQPDTFVRLAQLHQP